MSASPVVARRASALLGEAVALDALDALVLGKLKPRTSGTGQVIRADGDAAWTLDVLAMRVLLPDGRTIDLSAKKVLFDLLVALCKHGGSATKEQLLERAWGVREYHPLRHDNRLKVAVRKLRRLLEETLGDDPLEATEDGYRLRGHVRLVGDTQP
jgi:DNA-binding response OmpR family regulator